MRQTERTFDRDLAILKGASKDTWPMYPMMPMKRPRSAGQWPELGVVIAADELAEDLLGKPGTDVSFLSATRYVVFLDAQIETPGETIRKILVGEHASKIAYASYEAMLADGWLID